jgi:hypothetical protein
VQFAQFLTLVAGQAGLALVAIELVLLHPQVLRLIAVAEVRSDVCEERPERTSCATSRRDSGGYGGHVRGLNGILSRPSH